MDELEQDLREVAAIGADGDGVKRLAWSPELLEAYSWFARRGADLGLAHDVDAAGNAFLRWGAGEGPALLLGSHLDSVPSAGRYDGTLGVLTGLDVLRSLKGRGVAPRKPVWLTAFMDEEGTRFGTALLGSKAFVGHDLGGAGERKDAGGTTLRDAMRSWGCDFDRLAEARAIDTIDGYLELHIEQGPVLEDEGLDVGVVTSIVGLLGLHVRFEGQANHAGTTPMRLRRDAFAGAARVALELRDLALASEGMTTNVGVVTIENSGKNVVPGACEFTIDIRSATRAGYDRLDAQARGIVARIAAEERLAATVGELYRLDPVPMDAAMIDALERAADCEGASFRRMPSGAGHDAMILGAVVPAGMLFVPSRGGVSHNPAEHTTPAQCSIGSRVLARAVESLVA